jgi:hypothetical protein
LFKSLFKSDFATRTEIQFTCRRLRSQQSHSKRSRPRGGFSAQHLRDLDASVLPGTIAKMRMGKTIRRAAVARVPIPACGKRCRDPGRVARASNRVGQFSAKAALTSRTLSPCGFSRWRRSAASSSNLLRAILLGVRFMPRCMSPKVAQSRCDGRSDKCRLLRKLRTKRAAVAPCTTAVRTLARDFAHHRIQRVDNTRNSARLPRYLAAGRVLSNPPIIVAP